VEFWTIEVLGGSFSARAWQRAHREALVEAALTHGAQDWRWVVRGWGVILELAFPDEAQWLRFRGTPAVRAALDAVPDPVSGLLVYSGRGGSSAAGIPRSPRPRPLAGAAALLAPEPRLSACAASHLQPAAGTRSS